MMAYWRRRSFLIGAAYYLVVSLGIIFFSSPLFRVLGFEFSGFIALFASIHLLFFSTNESITFKDEDIWTILQKLSVPILVLSSIPLVVSLITSLFIPNCSLGDGII